MKKILLSIISIIMLFGGVVFSACGGGEVVSAIVLESEAFVNDDKDYIEIDITDEESRTVEIKATIENMEQGIVSVKNPNEGEVVYASSRYNASLNTNTITITTLGEGTADIIIGAEGTGRKIEDKKIRVYVYSDITGLAQKEENLTGKKTQYIVMDKNILLESDAYLDITSKDSCNRKDIVWSVIEDYGNALTIRNGNLLRLDSYLFGEYKKSIGKDVSQITIQAQSKYRPEIVTEVTLDILTGIDDEDASVLGAYDIGGTKFDLIDADGKIITYELVRTNSADEHSILYYFVDIKTENNITWVPLTDEVLFKNFDIPAGTLDITNERYAYDTATKTHSYVFKVVNENSLKPANYEFNFSFAYDNYDYVFTTHDVRISLIDIVTKIEVTNVNKEVLNDRTIEVYNNYENGKGQLLNVDLSPTTAKDSSYYLKLKVAKDVANNPSFNYTNFVQICTEAGGEINFTLDAESTAADADYAYYNSANGTELRTFLNATSIYVMSKQPSSAFELCFYSNAKATVHTSVKMQFVFAPSEHFAITAPNFEEKIETSALSTKTIEFSSNLLASVDVSSLELVYPRSEGYQISSLRKAGTNFSFDISTLKTDVNTSFDIELIHKNGFKATSSFNVELFRAITSASVSLLKANSDNIAQYQYLDQNFGGGVNNTLSQLIINFGTGVELDFNHDAGDDVVIEVKYFINEVNGVDKFEGLTLEEELAAFFASYDASKATTGYMEYLPTLKTLNFMTSKKTDYRGYVVVEFNGYDVDHNPTKLYRIIDVESYVPVSMLSTKKTLIETIASDSLSALDAETLSSKNVDVKFRNDPSTTIPITYYDKVYFNDVVGAEKPNFTIYSSSASRNGINGNYEFRASNRTLYYKNLAIYSLNDFVVNSKNMNFNIYAHSTSEFTEFVDTLVIEYNSFFSTFRLSIDIVISNSQRVTSLIWENATDDGTMYLLLSADGSIGANNKHTIITTVSEAYNTQLVYKYNPVSGQNNVISFANNGKYQDVVVNPTARIGGNGYIYVLPADSVKTNELINFNYYDEGGNIKTDYVALSDLNYKKDDATWYDFLMEKAFFIDAKSEVVPFNQILVRINLIVADGLSEETALRIYTAEEVKAISYVNHYILMDDVELTMTAPLFDKVHADDPEVLFIGSLRGYDENVTITLKNSTALFYQIGAAGKVYDLTFNGTVDATARATGAGFVAHRNNGLIENVTVDVWFDGTRYVPSVVKGYSYAGALVQENYGIIRNSSALGVSLSGQIVGGIAGSLSGQIQNCRVELYKFATDVAGVTENNTFVGSGFVGGIAGSALTSSAKISSSYIYDYSLDGTTIASNLLAPSVGAFVGSQGYDPGSELVQIENSFAVANVNVPATSAFVQLADCYISYFKDDGGIVYHSDITKTNPANWIEVTDVNFNEKVNSFGDEKFAHLLFHQLEFVDIASLVFENNTSFIKVNDTTAILFLYEVDTHTELTVVEQLALSRKNKYSLETLFGLEERFAEGLVVTSSDSNIVEASMSEIEVKKTGKITLNVLSKQDFSISEPYSIEVIRVIKDFKATYNGFETTGIEVQEGRSAQIDFTTLSTTYLNTSTNFNLVLDKFAVVTDNVEIEKDGTTYAVYTVENAVGMINVYAGAKTEVGSFVVNSYIALSTLDTTEKQEALKAYSLKELTITPFEGSNEIGVDYSSITIYPSLSSQFEVVLNTDSATDGIIITGEFETSKLNVYKVNPDKSFSIVPTKQIIVNPSESGEYVLSFGALDKRLSVKITASTYNLTTNEITYSITLKIHDDHKSSISTSEKYKLFFNSRNDKDLVLTKTLDVVLESQKIDNIDVTNYKISQVTNKNGVYTYTKTNTSVSLMAPGQSSIFEVIVDPKYSYYEYLTVNYVPQGNAVLTFSALNKDGNGYTSNNNSAVTNIAYGLKVVPDVKTSVYAFKLYVSTNVESDCIIPITVSFYGYNSDGSPKLLESRETSIYVTCMKQPSVLVNGSEFTKIAKGSSAKVEVTVNTDQDLESITLEGNAVTNITLSHQTTVFNEDGTKTYVYKLNASILASVAYDATNNPSGVGQFEIKGTIARVIDGVRETKSMSALVALVEFDVSSVEVIGGEYDEDLGMDVFTAYENINKNFEFDYNFVPESYGLNLTAEELIAMQRLNERKTEFSQNGYYSDEKSYYINYSYDSEKRAYNEIPLKDQLYVVSSTGKEQKLNWTPVSGVEGDFSYTHFDGNYAKFKITYKGDTKQFVIMGNSTTSGIVLFRLKNITYLTTAGNNVYWESSYDFGIRVKSYTSEDSPEAINNAQDFLDIQKEGEEKPYILMNDIVLENYVPFDTKLISSLDGNGHTIHINSFDMSQQTGTFNAALFTTVTQNTILKNVRVNWYNGGQISVDVSVETGFGGVRVAGLAITNSGIIYNCEAVAYFSKAHNTQNATGQQGLVVSYVRGQTPYFIDGNSSVSSIVSGLVIDNSGNITNSRVGGESIRVLDDDTDSYVGRAYYLDTKLETFTISGQGEVNGFVSKNSNNIAASKVTNVQINNLSTYNLMETAGFANTNSGSISTSYVAGKDDGTSTFSYLSTCIDSEGIISGFVVTNATGASVTNCLSNIRISNTSTFGSGFVYRNEGAISYCFSASQVEKANFTQMGFTGLDEKGNILSDKGEISFSYYYDMNFSTGSTLEHQIDTGALLLDLGSSNSISQYYGLSFASGNNEEEMLANGDGIWYMREDGKVSIIAADTIAYSVRYIAGRATDNSFLYVYSDMIDNDIESYTYGHRHTTQLGSQYNPIIISSAKDFDDAMGNSKSTNISSYFDAKEVYGSYRFVNDISLEELGTNADGNVTVSSTSKTLTHKKDESGKTIGVGQVDGNGFKIDNISIATNDKSVLGGAHTFGLFASLTNGAKVLNLTLGVLNVTADDVYVVGSLAGLVHNSSIINITVDQNYAVNTAEDLEATDDGVMGQNIAGGVVGVVFGYSTVKSVTINNAMSKVSYYDSGRNPEDRYFNDGLIDTINDNFYLNSGFNLVSNRANLLTSPHILSMFSNFSMAGGVAGYVDVFNESQRVQTSYIHQSIGERVYRIKNILADKTVNVRGEVVGGLFGYTSPTTNSENIKLRLSVDIENNTLISKILSYNSYAGGIVGIGSGYIYRATLEHDDATQKLIEEGYKNYYQGGDEEPIRGILDLFYTTYTGSIAYDYKTQVIGGIAGIMVNGEIDNSYSKINVIAEPQSATTAGGIIGKISKNGTIFSFMVDAKVGDTPWTTSSTVFLKEVYASGDVRGGFYKVLQSGGIYDYFGYGGGIVGLLDRNAVLAVQAVNAVNAFSYDDVLTKAENEGDPKTGELSSVGVYALVSGNASSRGTIKIIMPPVYDEEGDSSGVAAKSVGYFSKIKNQAEETISVELYPGVLRVGFEPEKGAQALFEMISVSNFTGIVDGYNSVLSAFLVGKHWNPTKWDHTEEFIYPQIKYTSIKTFFFLDRDNVAEVVAQMQNNDITVRVRGLDEATGTYGDVDLSAYNIVGFAGEIIGPAGWLTEEELENGVIARHKKNGDFVGINLKEALFSSSKSFICRDLDIIYGVRNDDPDATVNDNKISITSDPDKVEEVSTMGSAFISGMAEKVKLSNLKFHILNHSFTITPVNGNAGFIASSIIDCNLENLEIFVNLPSGLTGSNNAVISVSSDSSVSSLNAGVFVGTLEVGANNGIKGNKVTIGSLNKTMLLVRNVNEITTKINVGGLIGLIKNAPTITSPATVEILNFATDDLIQVQNYAPSITGSEVYVGGQIGKITGIKTLQAESSVTDKHNAVYLEGQYEKVYYGGVIGHVEALETFILNGTGIPDAKISSSYLINKSDIGNLVAGGVFGFAGCDFAFEGSVVSKLGNFFGFGNSIKTTPSTYYTIGGGSVGGIIGQADSKIIVTSIDAEILIGEFDDTAGADVPLIKDGVCQNLGEMNIGALIGKNTQVLVVNNTDLSGYISANTTGYVGGGVGLVSADSYFGTKPQSGDSNYISGVHDRIVEGGVKSSVDIITNGTIGGLIGFVDADKKLKLQDAMYDGMIHIFTTSTPLSVDKNISIGGVIGYVKEGTSGSVDEVSIIDSIFGGTILLLGDSNKYYYEGVDRQKSILVSDLNVSVGGIVGQFEHVSGANPVGEIISCYSYGDVIVAYADKFSKMSQYAFGGIVGRGCKSNISKSVSIMTNNNDKISEHYYVGPIVGINNGATAAYGLGTGANINKYNSSLSLCYDDNAQDIGYYTAYTATRTGRNANGDDYNLTDNAISLIQEALKAVHGEIYTVAGEIKGSKLNPHQYSTNTQIEAKTRIVYITESGNVEVGEGKTVSAENGLALREGIKHDEYQDDEDEAYSFGVAFIGDGFKTTYSLDYAIEAPQTISYSLFNVMEQNDIISGVVAGVDLQYDLNHKIVLKTELIDGVTESYYNTQAGALVGWQEGGVIFASGAIGNLSVGAYCKDGATADTGTINLGGLVGLVTSGRIAESYSAVNVTYRAAAGGNVSGFANIETKNLDTDTTESPVNVIDHTANADISGSFSTGKVETYCSANAYAFAKAKQNSGTTAKINNCYTVSPIDRKDHTTAGLDGDSYVEVTGEESNFKSDGATITNCYYSKDATTNGTTGGTVKNGYTLPTLTDTNFTGWKTGSGIAVNYGYPLRHFGYLQRSTRASDGYLLVPNAEVLEQVVSGENYRLEHNIDLSKTESYKGNATNPTEAYREISYTGIFDGNSKTINGLQYAGLFSVLSGATIKDLRLTNFNVTINAGNDIDLGAVARQTGGTILIENVMVSGNLTMKEPSNSVGSLIGLTGTSTLEVKDCENYAKIVAEGDTINAGGLVGGTGTSSNEVKFSLCTNYGTIEAQKTGQVGGIVGALNGSNNTLTKCGNTNSVICGYQHNTDGDYYAGGIAGKVQQGDFGQCYNTAMIKAGNISNKTGNSYAGGIAAHVIDSGSASNCLNQGVIEAISSVEGATTTYSFEGDNTIKFVYSDGITRVHANAFANGVTATTSANYAVVRNNGLYGKKEFSQTFGFDNMENGGFNKELTTNDITLKVGASSEATVYVSQQDELGAPVSYFITVPRTITYPTNGLGNITRKQEISCSGTFTEAETYSYGSVSYYEAPTSCSDDEFWNVNNGVYYLAFMETIVDSETSKQCRIGADKFDLPENENQLYMSINQYAKTLRDTFTGTIGGKTIKTLHDAGYTFEVVVSGSYSGYGMSQPRGVATYNNTTHNLDVVFSFNLESAGITVNPTVTYTIKAKKQDSVLTETLSKSNLLWQKRLTGVSEITRDSGYKDGYYVIYLDNEVIGNLYSITEARDLNAAEIEEVKAKLQSNNGRYFKVTFAKTGFIKTFELVKYNAADNCFVIMDKEAYNNSTYPDGLIPFLNKTTMTFDINQNNTLEARKVVTGTFADFTKISGADVGFDKTIGFASSTTFNDGTTSFTFNKNPTLSDHTINGLEIDAKVTDNNSGNYYDKEAPAGTKHTGTYSIAGQPFTANVTYNSVTSTKVNITGTSGSGSATKTNVTSSTVDVTGGVVNAGSITVDGASYNFGYSAGNYYIHDSMGAELVKGSVNSGDVTLDGKPYTYNFTYDSGAKTLKVNIVAKKYYGQVTIDHYGTFSFEATSASNISISGYTVSSGYFNTADYTFKVAGSESSGTMTVSINLVKYSYEFSSPTINSFSGYESVIVDGSAINVTTSDLARNNISEITREEIVYGRITPKLQLNSLAVTGTPTTDAGKYKFSAKGSTILNSATFTPTTTFDSKKDYYDTGFKKTVTNYGATETFYANYSVTAVSAATPSISGGTTIQLVVQFTYVIEDVAIKVRGTSDATETKTGGELSATMKYDIKTNKIKVTNAAGVVTEETFVANKVYFTSDGGAGTYSFQVIDAKASGYNYEYKLYGTGYTFIYSGTQTADEKKFNANTDGKLHVSVYKKGKSVYVSDGVSYNVLIDTEIAPGEVLPGTTPTVDSKLVSLNLIDQYPSTATRSDIDTSAGASNAWSGEITIKSDEYNWSATTNEKNTITSLTIDGTSVDVANTKKVTIEGKTYKYFYQITSAGGNYTFCLTLMYDSDPNVLKKTATANTTRQTGTNIYKAKCVDFIDATVKSIYEFSEDDELEIVYDSNTKRFYFNGSVVMKNKRGVVFVITGFDETTNKANITYYHGTTKGSLVQTEDVAEKQIFPKTDTIFTSFAFHVDLLEKEKLAYVVELSNLHWTEINDTQNIMTKTIANNTKEFSILDYEYKDYYQVQQNGLILNSGVGNGYIETDSGKKVEVFGVREPSEIKLVVKYKVYNSSTKSFSGSVDATGETAKGTILIKDYRFGELKLSGGANLVFNGLRNISGNGYVISYTETNYGDGNMFGDSSGYLKNLGIAASIFIAKEDVNASMLSDSATGNLINVTTYGSIAIQAPDIVSGSLYKKIVGNGLSRDISSASIAESSEVNVYVNFSTYYNKFDDSAPSLGVVGYYNTFYNITSPADGVYTFDASTETYTLNEEPEVDRAQFYGLVVGFDGKDGKDGEVNAEGAFDDATDGLEGQTVSTQNGSHAILIKGRGGDGGKGRDGNNGKDYTDKLEDSFEASKPTGNTSGAEGADKGNDVHRNTLGGKDGYIGFYGLNLRKYTPEELLKGTEVRYDGDSTKTIGASTEITYSTQMWGNSMTASIKDSYIEYQFQIYTALAGTWEWFDDLNTEATAERLTSDNIYIYANMTGEIIWKWEWGWQGILYTYHRVMPPGTEIAIIEGSYAYACMSQKGTEGILWKDDLNEKSPADLDSKGKHLLSCAGASGTLVA